MFVGAAQFLLSMIITESIYPGYNIQQNYISDLGIGPTSFMFNTSVISLGIFLLLSMCFLNRARVGKWLIMVLAITAVGAIGVGIFNEGSPFDLHSLFSLVVFLFGGISAIMSSGTVKLPFSFLSAWLARGDWRRSESGHRGCLAPNHNRLTSSPP